MTWVKGTSTWGAIEHLIPQLMCGEVADGSGTTVAAASQWVREVSRTVTDGVLNSTTTVTSATANFVATDVGSLVTDSTGVPLTAARAWTPQLQVNNRIATVIAFTGAVMMPPTTGQLWPRGGRTNTG